jgi:hypothetical protein
MGAAKLVTVRVAEAQGERVRTSTLKGWGLRHGVLILAGLKTQWVGSGRAERVWSGQLGGYCVTWEGGG